MIPCRYTRKIPLLLICLSVWIFAPFLSIAQTQTNYSSPSPITPIESHVSSYRLYQKDELGNSNILVESDNWGEFSERIRAYEFNDIFYITFDFNIVNTPKLVNDMVVRIHMIASHEFYFNNVLIGKNGSPASTKTGEQPGMVWTSYLLPKELLTQGEHQITLRASAHQRQMGMKLLRELNISFYDPAFNYISTNSLISALLVSISGILSVYFLLLFLTERNSELLVFSVFLGALMIYGYAIQWDHLFGYHYHWELVNNRVELFSSLVLVISLPSYFLLKHQVARPWLWLLIGAVVVIVIQSFASFDESKVVWSVCFLVSLGASLYGLTKKQIFTGLETLGLVICLIGTLSVGAVEDLFLYFPLLLAFILLTHAIAMRKRKLNLQAAELVKATLEGELIKRHIQPHFLLNSLTSLIEWVETDTEKSTEFIVLLADEFRLMSKAAQQNFVPLSLEVELCNRHLSLMSLRTRMTCQLDTDGISGDELFPPAIFHTLIENAFTHNKYKTKSLTFRLEKREDDANHCVYHFYAPIGEKLDSKFQKIGTGTGLKYIKSRLNQGFGAHWHLQERCTETYWITEIQINYQKIKLPKGDRK